jgi:hypothetical protein
VVPRDDRQSPRGLTAEPGSDWTPEFDGQRPPFQKGNTIALRHGAYADVKLGPRVEELADEIRPFVPGYAPGDEIGLRVLCLCLARLEASAAADSPEHRRLREDEKGWANTVRRYLADLGLTPTSRAALGVNLSRARGDALRQHLAAEYGEDGTP